MSTHEKFSASSAFRWLSCSKSLTLPQKEQKESPYAAKGTALHELSEDMLRGNEPKLVYGDYTPTEEDIDEIVLPYVNFVKDIKASHKFYEEKVMLAKDCGGTIDALCYDEDTKTLWVCDLKTGVGLFVKNKLNKQLCLYAIGAIDFLRKKNFKVEKIFTCIIQPPLNNISSIEVEKSYLKQLRTDILQRVKDVNADKTVFSASGDNCRWCPHAADCPEVAKNALLAAKEDFKEERDKLSLSEKMKMVPILNAFIDNVEKNVFTALDCGEVVEGFKLATGRGSRKWKNEEEIVKYLKENGLKDKELKEPSKLLSVAKMEKVIKKKKVEVDIVDFIQKSEGSLKVKEI